MKSILDKVYNAESFRSKGHQLIDLIADHLKDSLTNRHSKVLKWKEPDDQLDFWNNFNANESFHGELLKRSINLYHPRYMGHQISPPAPDSVLADMVTAYLNNGMGVYEMGGPSTSIERLVINTIAKKIGYGSESDGFLTSGGTLANLTALLTARSKINNRHVWSEGYNENDLVVIVSEQAHYCIDRAARIMGLGNDGIMKVPVDKNYKIIPSEVKRAVERSVAENKKVLAIVGSACTTSTGSYDDLIALSEISNHYDIWFHVDGAHGGAVVFSEKYRNLVGGIEHADSVAIDCHKMMMTPSVTTALLYKNGDNSYSTFSQNANYLFEKNEDREWFNLAKRTFECTKLMMGVKFYNILLQHGDIAVDAFVTTLHDKAKEFADLVNEDPGFDLAVYPESNIVCYRAVVMGLDADGLNDLNSHIRRKVLEEGQFYIVQTLLNGNIYLRNTMMNPFTTREDMKSLLYTLKELVYLG